MYYSEKQGGSISLRLLLFRLLEWTVSIILGMSLAELLRQTALWGWIVFCLHGGPRRDWQYLARCALFTLLCTQRRHADTSPLCGITDAIGNTAGRNASVGIY